MILGYCRISTEDQRKNTSPEEQERVLRGFAMMKGAKTFDVAIFHDCISGSTPLDERPGGRELMAAAKQGDIIVAVKLDRLFRSASDALVMAEKFKQDGVDLVLTDMGNEPVTQNGSSKLFFTLLAAVAEFERDRIAERIQTGKRAKVANGGHAGGKAPYGYRQVGKGRKAKLDVNEQEQGVIRIVRELSANKIPVGQICREINDRIGLRNRAGHEFQIVHVQRMLRRENHDAH